MKKQSGFTLIELMVVMAILAILATAGLSAYTSYIKEARDTTRLQIAKQLGIKVEQLSNISGAPDAGQLEAFLTAENFGYKLPEMSPVIAKISESINGAFGTAFALPPDIDPLKGKPVCLDENNVSRIVCGFSYFQFSDGTYAIGYAVEKKDNKINFLFDPAGSRSGATDTYASFIGNSPIVTLVNGGNSSAGSGMSIATAVATVQNNFSLGSFSIQSSQIISNTYSNTNGGDPGSISESISDSVYESVSESVSDSWYDPLTTWYDPLTTWYDPTTTWW